MRSYRFSWLILGCLSGCLVASLYYSFADKAESYFSGQVLPSVYTPLHPAETHYSIQLVRGNEDEKSEEQKRQRRGTPPRERIKKAFREGNSECHSRKKLEYSLSPKRGLNNTLRHIESHLRNNLRKSIHSVFHTGGDYTMHYDLVELIDHIYENRRNRSVNIHATSYHITSRGSIGRIPGDQVEYTIQPANLNSAAPTGWQGGYNGDGRSLYGYFLVLENTDRGTRRVVTFFPV